MTALGKLIERNRQWFMDFGSWIFAGLIAFNLLVVAALLTVGPADNAIIVSAAAFALALPPDVAGFFLLRLVRDLEQVELEKEAAEAFKEVGFDVGEKAFSPEALEAVQKRRTAIVLRYSYPILGASVLLTLIGMTAALWHMAWWIGVIFFAMVVISSGIVIQAFVSSGSTLDPRPAETP